MSNQDYSGDLNTHWFGIQMVKKRLDAQLCGYLLPFEYWTAQPFEYPSCFFVYWSGIQMVGLVHRTWS